MEFGNSSIWASCWCSLIHRRNPPIFAWEKLVKSPFDSELSNGECFGEWQFGVEFDAALGEISRRWCSISFAMRSVGSVTQFLLNKSRRNRIEVQRFRQWKNKGNRGVLQYNSNDSCPKFIRHQFGGQFLVNLGVGFCQALGCAIPKKWQAVQKKRQAKKPEQQKERVATCYNSHPLWEDTRYYEV